MKEIRESDYYKEDDGVFEYKAFLNNHFKVWLIWNDYELKIGKLFYFKINFNYLNIFNKELIKINKF